MPPGIHPGAALFLDVDGTLLDIAARPELVRVPRDLPQLLGRLAAQRGGALAVVSGRSLAQIDRVLHPWNGAAAGLHGGERQRADGERVESEAGPVDLAAAASLERLRPALAEIAADFRGIWLEDKGGTLALHCRDAPKHSDELGERINVLLAAEQDTLRVIAGKMVFEVQPRHHGKGGAIAAFMEETPFRGRLPVFAGDDTTDEDGFREVNRRGGISVRVGAPLPTTAATYALPSPATVLEWLRRAVEEAASPP